MALRGFAGMDQGPTNRLLAPWAVEGGRDVEKRMYSPKITTDSGVFCTTFGEDWWCEEAGGNGGEW